MKVLTEGLAHALRNIEGCQVTAHLLVPGSTFTGMTARGRTEKPPGPWMPEHVVDFMVAGMAAGDSYISCPDNASPAISTIGASSGQPRTSFATAPPCRAGTRTTKTNSPSS